MRDIFFPQSFEAALAKASFTVLFLYAAADKLFGIENLRIGSKTYEGFAGVQDKDKHAAIKSVCQ